MSVSSSYLKLGLYVNSGLNLGFVPKFVSLLCTRMWSLLLLVVDEEARSSFPTPHHACPSNITLLNWLL